MIPWAQWQHAQARAVRINGKQRAFFQLRCHLPQGDDDLLTDHIRAYIIGTDLHDAGFFAPSVDQCAASMPAPTSNPTRRGDRFISTSNFMRWTA